MQNFRTNNFLVFFICFFLTVSSNAAIRRVGYIATIQPVSGLDFNNFQAAHDASVNGDTIQLYPSTAGSANYTGTISKGIVIIGLGYFTNSYYLTGTESANGNLQNMPGSISSCTFSIDNGSEGTIIQGINNLTINTVDQVNSLNSITLSRCRNVSISFVNSGNCDGWTIEQCYGVTIVQSSSGPSFTGNRTITNFNIKNSVLFSGISLDTSPIGIYTGNIYNCAILNGHSLFLNNALFKIQNCIFESQNFSGIDSVSFVKNITTYDSANNPLKTNNASSGNKYNVSLSNVFVGYPTNTIVSGLNTYSDDAAFKLLTGGTNPALNGGLVPNTSTATDCGIYGGVTTSAYILSGLPAIPVYYQLSAPSAETTGSNYTITFSVRSNN